MMQRAIRETGVTHMTLPIDFQDLVARAYAADPTRTENELLALATKGGISLTPSKLRDLLSDVKVGHRLEKAKKHPPVLVKARPR